jgi:hypothetical protein
MNHMSVERIYEGSVDKWVDRGNASSFGFIEFEHGARIDRIFFYHASITQDNIGRTLHGRIAGNLVRFKIEKSMYRGEVRPRATGITSVFPCDVPNTEDHREISTVEKLAPSYVYLRRQCGDELYLGSKDVVEAFRDRWSTLRKGSRVWHGVAASDDKHQTFRAVCAELFAPDEFEESKEK